jgi:hypothetical protein
VDVAALVADLVRAMVLATAATAKLVVGGADVAGLRVLGFPDAVASRLPWGLPATEMAVAVLLAGLPTARFGAALAAGLLLALTLVLGVSIARRNSQPCSVSVLGRSAPAPGRRAEYGPARRGPRRVLLVP